ncbi:MAG: hypothetical protein P8H44_00515 [Flavobacteriaceae bacterium]|nr:hypothetical protein [Flavobacteriaceae bacterium]
MKKIILLIVLCGFLSTANAQRQSYQEKKATKNAQHIAEAMDLNESEQTLLYAILLDKYEETSKQIKGNDLSKEEKKIIYNKSYKDTNDKLSVLFSKEEIKTVNALLKKQNQKKK